MRAIIITTAVIATLTLTPALASHGGHAAAQGNPVWQNPAIDQTPYHSQEYSAPIDPSMLPHAHQYVEPRRTVICTRGKNGQFFCN